MANIHTAFDTLGIHLRWSRTETAALQLSGAVAPEVHDQWMMGKTYTKSITETVERCSRRGLAWARQLPATVPV